MRLTSDFLVEIIEIKSQWNNSIQSAGGKKLVNQEP